MSPRKLTQGQLVEGPGQHVHRDREKEGPETSSHLTSSGGWGKGLVAPTAGWLEGAGEGLGHPAASPEVATRGRAGHTGKKMRVGGKQEVSLARASKLNPHSPCLGWGARFCQSGALSEVTVRLAAGVRWRAGVDNSEHPSVPGFNALSLRVSAWCALRSRKRAQGRGSHRQRGCVRTVALVCVWHVCAHAW